MNDSRFFRALLFVALVVVLNLPAPASLRVRSLTRDAFVPFQNVAGLLLDRGREIGAVCWNARRILDERRRLVEENASLRENLRRLNAMEQENRDLRVQLGFKERSDNPLEPARVIARGSTSGWWQTVRLNKGRRDGIRANMAVITTDGLLGRTMTVSRNTCDVLLLIDPNCRVSCRFERTGALGIAQGGGVSLKGSAKLEMLCAVDPFRVDYVAKGHHVFKGDRVVTSGLGGIFPEGLLLGRVMRAGLDESGLYRRATLEPAVNMGDLRYVFIVIASVEGEEE